MRCFERSKHLSILFQSNARQQFSTVSSFNHRSDTSPNDNRSSLEYSATPCVKFASAETFFQVQQIVLPRHIAEKLWREEYCISVEKNTTQDFNHTSSRGVSLDLSRTCICWILVVVLDSTLVLFAPKLACIYSCFCTAFYVISSK